MLASFLTAILFVLGFAVAAPQVWHTSDDASALIQSSLEGLARAELLHDSQELTEEDEEKEPPGGPHKNVAVKKPVPQKQPAPGPHGKAVAKVPVPENKQVKKPQSAQEKLHAGVGPAKKVSENGAKTSKVAMNRQHTAKATAKAKANQHGAAKKGSEHRAQASKVAVNRQGTAKATAKAKANQHGAAKKGSDHRAQARKVAVKGQGAGKATAKSKANANTAKEGAQHGSPQNVSITQSDEKENAAVQVQRKVEENVDVQQEPVLPRDVHLIIAGTRRMNNVTVMVPAGKTLKLAVVLASRELGIQMSDVHGLKLHGKRVNLTDTALQAGVKDYDLLDMQFY